MGDTGRTQESPNYSRFTSSLCPPQGSTSILFIAPSPRVLFRISLALSQGDPRVPTPSFYEDMSSLVVALKPWQFSTKKVHQGRHNLYYLCVPRSRLGPSFDHSRRGKRVGGREKRRPIPLRPCGTMRITVTHSTTRHGPVVWIFCSETISAWFSVSQV
jgi:hypothetical protein